MKLQDYQKNCEVWSVIDISMIRLGESAVIMWLL